MSDWMDDGWIEFADGWPEMASVTDEVRQLLKEAWLHGARSAVAQAQSLVSASLENEGPENIVARSRTLPR
jgi:hypothetical protein